MPSASRALGAQARAVVVPNTGHGTLGLACLRDAVYRFVDAPTDAAAQAVDFSCAAHVPRPQAFQPMRPSRAASAANDPGGFGEESTRAPHAPALPGKPAAADQRRHP
jgi:hypothetical protein